jgi:uncharacterized protein CbrC (UPF0167 family)
MSGLGTPRQRAAKDLIEALKRRELVELGDPEPLANEIAALLESYERRLLKPSPELTASLATDLCTLVLESDNVDEIFADDAQLARLVNATLMDFTDALARRPASPASRVVAAPKKVTIADDGFEFALFEGSLDEAVDDREGLCAVCNKLETTRFNNACYACFSSGKAPRTADTELGMVVPGKPDTFGGDIDLEAAKELSRTPQYSTWQGESWLICCKRPMIFTGAPDLSTDAKTLATMLGTNEADAATKIEQLQRDAISVYGFRCTVCSKRRAHWDMD